jgi:NitT/TauT family transport system permease protein
MTISTIRNSKIIKAVVVTALWLALWHIISLAVNEEILFVSPLRVASTLFEMMQTAEFWNTAGMTMLRVMSGFVIGFTIGTVLAVFASRMPFFYAFVKPAVSIVKATPVASFIILALVWIRSNSNATIFICSLMVIPIAWGNCIKGLQQVDAGLLEMARLYHFGVVKTFRLVRLPSVMPYLMSAATTGLGLTWKAGIAAEVLCRPAMSIGKNIYESKLYLDTPHLFAWTTLVVVMSIILEKVLVFIMSRTLKKYNSGGAGNGN